MEYVHSGTCGVCKSPLLEKTLIACSGCRVLYHDECWGYNRGRCAVYGCVPALEERDPLPSVRSVPSSAVPRWAGGSIPDTRDVSILTRHLGPADWVMLGIVAFIALLTGISLR